jgi:hypothetical protein
LTPLEEHLGQSSLVGRRERSPQVRSAIRIIDSAQFSHLQNDPSDAQTDGDGGDVLPALYRVKLTGELLDTATPRLVVRPESSRHRVFAAPLPDLYKGGIPPCRRAVLLPVLRRVSPSRLRCILCWRGYVGAWVPAHQGDRRLPGACIL